MSYSIDSNSSRVRQNKSGEVWSSNLGDLDVELYPPKNIFGTPYFGPCALKFLHALEHDRLTSAPPTGDVGPLTIFFKGGVKNWLKM